MSEKLFNIVAIEGIDGTGKSTLCKRLKAMEYENRGIFGHISDYTEEPRKRSPYRASLLNFPEQLDSIAQLILVTADRYEHIRTYRDLRHNNDLIIDRLITDRYNDSTWVYQVVLGGVAEGTFHKFEEIFEIQQPDLVILLDLDPEIAMKRIEERNEEKNHFDSVAMDRKRTMRKAYLDRASTGNKRGTHYAIIDASMSMDRIVDTVVPILTYGFTVVPDASFSIYSGNEDYVDNCFKYLKGGNDDFCK